MNRYIKEVFDAHELIQRWFTDAAAPQRFVTNYWHVLARRIPW